MPARIWTDWKAVDAQRRRCGIPSSDETWARGQVETFPVSWVGRLLSRWRERHAVEPAAANLGHLRACTSIRQAERAGVRADANDADVCQAAADTARDMARRLDYIDQQARVRLADREPEQRERLTMLGRYLEAAHWMEARGLGTEFLRLASRSIVGALRRVCCERWWRRVMRKTHARAVEGTARALGLVHKRAGCYVSDDAMRRRRGQRARNEAALESVRAVNEHGQDYTLAELAAKGPANREIRRHELMTRIAGFETIAKECGHAALFVTVTCPSRMHAWRTKREGYGVEPNPKHDGTTPEAAQRYLSRQWAACRAACDRNGVELYGFRIAEPNHDGTPHWHMLLFVHPVVARGTLRHNPRAGRKVADRVLLRLLRRYFLRNTDADERGAKKHRVKVERIDWARGSAAGYVAKYVAKNIDGYKVEKDLYGNDALTSSQRVEAWAATWRIRQFQQVGGAPVGVWRELRRLHPEQAGAAAAVDLALGAVNITADADKAEDERVQRYTAAMGWATYLHLQGGHRVKRAALRLGLLREQSGEVGRYGEVMAPRPVGVVTLDERRESVPAFGIVPATTRRRSVRVEVESERCSWIVVPAGFVEQARERMTPERSPGVGPMGAGQAADAAPVAGIPACGEAARPWSPVNNCTRPIDAAARAWFAPSVERVKKRGRWHAWARKSEPGGHESEGSDTYGQDTGGRAGP